MTARPRVEFSGPRPGEILDSEFRVRAEARHRAALVVACRSEDVEDCRELLAMLGLGGPDAVDDERLFAGELGRRLP